MVFSTLNILLICADGSLDVVLDPSVEIETRLRILYHHAFKPANGSSSLSIRKMHLQNALRTYSITSISQRRIKLFARISPVLSCRWRVESFFLSTISTRPIQFFSTKYIALKLLHLCPFPFRTSNSLSRKVYQSGYVVCSSLRVQKLLLLLSFLLLLIYVKTLLLFL